MKLTVPLPGVPLAVTALARILTFVPSLSPDGADGVSVSDGVGPVPPLEPAQPNKAASAAAVAAQTVLRIEVTDPPTRAGCAGLERPSIESGARRTGQKFYKFLQNHTCRPQRLAVSSCMEVRCGRGRAAAAGLPT